MVLNESIKNNFFFFLCLWTLFPFLSFASDEKASVLGSGDFCNILFDKFHFGVIQICMVVC